VKLDVDAWSETTQHDLWVSNRPLVSYAGIQFGALAVRVQYEGEDSPVGVYAFGALPEWVADPSLDWHPLDTWSAMAVLKSLRDQDYRAEDWIRRYCKHTPEAQNYLLVED